MSTDLQSEFLPHIGRHLAHELNNPISAISSAAFLIQDFIDTAEGGMLDTEMVKPFIESIREECSKMKSIVEEFAKFATTESILAMPINLNEFLRNRVSEISNSGIPATFIESKDAIGIMADAGQLQFVLKALTEFAMRNGATLISIAASSGDPCAITITDNRPGAPDEMELAQEFEPIPRKRSQGLGLTLPLAKKVIALHHGTIDISSSKENGVTICLQLPLTQEIAK